MLTRRDLRSFFLYLRVLSAVKIFPVDFDGEHGTLSVPRSPWKRGCYLGIFGLTLIHGCYIHFKLIQMLLNPEEVVRHHLVFHLTLSSASFVVHGCYLDCFVRNPQTFVTLFNDIFSTSGHDDGSNEWFEDTAQRHCYSRQELIAIAMPLMINLTVVLSVCLFTYDNTMVFLLYTSLPEEHKSLWWFLFLLCEETLYLTFMGFNAGIVLNAQLLFFEKITDILKNLNSSPSVFASRCSEATIEKAYHQLRAVQLKVNLFNGIHRFIVLSIKIFCITMCILNGYYMIAYFSADPIFGCIYCFLFGLLCTVYSIMYERAFTIPPMVGRAKSAALLRARTEVRGQEFKRKTEMQLRSVPEVGIQIGRFHTFERVATPVFVDFVLRNVAGLLVMHLRN